MSDITELAAKVEALTKRIEALESKKNLVRKIPKCPVCKKNDHVGMNYISSIPFCKCINCGMSWSDR